MQIQGALDTYVRLGMSSSTGTSFTPRITLAGDTSSCKAAPAATYCESVNTR
jgi:hypothetical protein